MKPLRPIESSRSPDEVIIASAIHFAGTATPLRHRRCLRAAGSVLACHGIKAQGDGRAYLLSDRTEACPLVRISSGVDARSSACVNRGCRS